MAGQSMGRTTTSTIKIEAKNRKILDVLKMLKKKKQWEIHCVRNPSGNIVHCVVVP